MCEFIPAATTTLNDLLINDEGIVSGLFHISCSHSKSPDSVLNYAS